MRAAERDNFPVGSIAGGSARHYIKVVTIGHDALVLGDEAYTRSIKHYLKSILMVWWIATIYTLPLWNVRGQQIGF